MPIFSTAPKSGSFEFEKPAPKYKLATGGISLGAAVAPMPGVIEKVLAEEGAAVQAGDPLVVMIAMKMEYVIKVSLTVKCPTETSLYEMFGFRHLRPEQ